MNKKIDEIIFDLNDFHNNMREIERITEFFNTYLKTVNNLNNDNISNAKLMYDKFNDMFNSREKEFEEIINSEKNTFLNLYNDTIKSINQNETNMRDSYESFIGTIDQKYNDIINSVNKTQETFNFYYENLNNKYITIEEVISELKSSEITKWVNKINNEIQKLTNDYKKIKFMQVIGFIVLGILLLLNLVI